MEFEKVKAKVTQSYPTLCDPTDCSCQAPLSMEFSQQEYSSGLPRPSPGDLPNPGIEPVSLAAPVLQADSLPLSQQGSPGKEYSYTNNFHPAIWILIDRKVLTLQMKNLSLQVTQTQQQALDPWENRDLKPRLPASGQL